MEIEKPCVTMAVFCKHATIANNSISVTHTIDYLIAPQIPAVANLFVALKFSFPRDYPVTTLQVIFRNEEFDVLKIDQIKVKPTQGEKGPAFGAIVFGAAFDITSMFHYLEITLLESEESLAMMTLPIYLTE